ncbi:hypothetical protein PQX77_009070, partial [Marasmius sp. AFHP31]
MDENPPTVGQYFVTTLCWEVGTQECTFYTVGVLVELCALFLTYGIHLVLFAVCISVLTRRRHKRFHLHCLLVTTLFVLATCGIVLDTASAILTVYEVNLLNSIPMMMDGGYLSIIWPSRSALEKLVGPQAPNPEDMWARSNLLFLYERKLEYAMQAIIVTSNLVTDTILGIASTLIVVRTALGIAINDEKSFRATVLGEGDGENGETRGIIDSVLDIRKPDESVMPHDEERAE